MTTFQPIPSEISTCTQWHHSQGCILLKQGAASIVAALAAIALITGTLLVLAQQGYQLGGINVIARMVESRWLYLGMGGAAILLTLDIAFILTQIHSYQNQTFSEEEVKKMKVEQFIQKNHIAEKLELSTYAAFTLPAVKTPAKAARPPVYALLHRTEEDDLVENYFRNPEEAAYAVQQLKQQNIRDGLEAFNNSQLYPAAYVESQLENHSRKVEPLFVRLQNCSCRIKEVCLKTGEPVWVVASKVSNQENLIYYRLQPTLEMIDPHLFILSTLEEKIARIVELVAAHCREDEVWPCEMSDGRITFYPVLFRSPEGRIDAYFFTTLEGQATYCRDKVNAREKQGVFR